VNPTRLVVPAVAAVAAAAGAAVLGAVAAGREKGERHDQDGPMGDKQCHAVGLRSS
jgi:hypothetical protein